MFKALMKVQWKWSQPFILLAALLAFALPLGSIRTLLITDYESNYYYSLPSVGMVVSFMQTAGVFYAFIAGATGLFVAVIAWNADHKGRHVYALSLPISRARYALYRFAAGGAFLLIPAIAVLVGGMIAISVATLPAGMHGYPVALTARFLLCSFLSFSIFFAIAAASQKSSAIMLSSIAGILVILVLLSAAGIGNNLMNATYSAIFDQPGLLSVFTGRWMLIDV
jgi:hypothetical protein